MQRRDSARAILLNDDDEVLLLEYEDDSAVDPANPGILRYWLTPGRGTVLSHEGLSNNEKQVFRDAAWWRVTDLANAELLLRPPALPETLHIATTRDKREPFLEPLYFGE